MEGLGVSVDGTTCTRSEADEMNATIDTHASAIRMLAPSCRPVPGSGHSRLTFLRHMLTLAFASLSQDVVFTQTRS
jgi:hypothetical protein